MNNKHSKTVGYLRVSTIDQNIDKLSILLIEKNIDGIIDKIIDKNIDKNVTI